MSRKKKQSETVVYPIFHMIKEFTLDNYWCDVLDSFANGKTSDMIAVKKECIFINGHEFDTTCFEKDGSLDEKAEMSMAIIEAMRTELKIMSDTERFEEKIDSFSSDEKSSSWSKVKSKAKRELCILQYAEKEQKQKKLSREERQNLYWFLVTAIDLGCVRPEDIHMENGRIEKIDGLLFLPETASYTLPEYNFPVSKSSAKAKMCSKMGAAFNRYLTAKSKELRCR
ncbi:hypothetical protein GMAR_ORF247 [Golden Marseillevirus]|uniref:hypothetical protein n=1 Tax=Golden Marseillevirus TaxID=1720526 RepID=UPI000877ADC2|nr:hypothetical protein GMAR_ORF247 [Golden Marseillevirus]ALX27621.1 hypothetical protein GMAR_ORF247 [Golden Marseillevirus]